MQRKIQSQVVLYSKEKQNYLYNRIRMVWVISVFFWFNISCTSFDNGFFNRSIIRKNSIWFIIQIFVVLCIYHWDYEFK